MALPVTFANLSGGNQLLSLLDTQFAAVAALGAIPCACSGTNTLTLTPLTNTPTISSYVDLQPSFVFVASQTSTAAVTANINLVGARNVYKWNGSQACASGDIIAGNIYRLTPLAALNGGLGGFVCDAIGVLNNQSDVQFIIDGGGVAITAGIKGFIRIPFPCNFASWAIMADQSGSIVIDVLGAQTAIPTTSIVGPGNKPTLTSAQFQNFQTISGWTTSSTPTGDFWLGFNVTSATTVTRVTLDISLHRI